MRRIKWIALIALMVQSSINVYSQSILRDSDGDGFIDGANLVWKEGYLYYPDNVPDMANYYPRRPSKSPMEDYDGDGLPDVEEDKNGNGVYEPKGSDGEPNTYDDETDFQDADTDDDGLSDAFELGFWPPSFGGPLSFADAHRLDPRNPDSDGDGLPDGLECGVVSPADGIRYGLVYIGEPPLEDTDRDATFSCQWVLKDGSHGNETRKAFIPDQDPTSRTNPAGSDTNYDGLEDGVQDANANGRWDNGETDAAAGWVGGYLGNSPLRHFEVPWEVYYEIRDGVLDPLDHEWQFFQATYQAPAGQDFTTGTLKMSHPNALSIIEINKLYSESRIYSVKWKWQQAEGDIIKIWAESPAFIDGKTPSIKIKCLPPIDID